jgi:hypothetical protein
VTIETTAAPAPLPWAQLLFWVFALGTAARLTWLAAGCWRIARYKSGATPLYPLPDSVATSRKLTGANALFCTSTRITGPVTFGFLQPVVLLPESFRSLDSDSQTAILCHELIHVRRRDWLETIVEEICSSLLWFHPAIWWVQAQTRLAREQLVDAEVVRLTENCEPYINALLEIAANRPTLDLAPAPLFLRRRHLAQRMRALLTEVSMSKRQLFTSYASIALIVAAAGWTAHLSFPLQTLAETGSSVQIQSEEGFVVTIPPLEYPSRAFEEGFEGEVVVDSHVISGPDDLRRQTKPSRSSWTGRVASFHVNRPRSEASTFWDSTRPPVPVSRHSSTGSWDSP